MPQATPDTFERACIGSLLTIPPKEASRLASAATADLFHNPSNSHIWSILRKSAMSGNPLGLETAAATVDQAPGLLQGFSTEDGAVLEHMQSCIQVVEQRNESWPRYVNELKLAHTRRKLIQAMDDAITDASSASTATEATNTALNRVIETAAQLRVVTKERQDDARSAVADFVDSYSRADIVYPFPQAGLNALGGIRPAEVGVMTAYTGSGKSLWLVDWLLEMADTCQGPIYLYSLEMSRLQIVRRILCQRFGLNMRDLVERKVEQAVLRASLDVIESLDIRIIDRDVTAARIHADVACAEVKPIIVAVDHIHLLPTSGTGDELSNFNKMVNSFKPLAIENDLAIMLLAQMRRPQGMSNEKQPRPHMGMLKGSSAIEQIADYIIMLYKDQEEGGFGHTRDVYEMWLEKVRDGEAPPAFNVTLQGLKFR